MRSETIKNDSKEIITSNSEQFLVLSVLKSVEIFTLARAGSFARLDVPVDVDNGTLMK